VNKNERRPVLGVETADVQSSYHMYVENSRSRIMKRSGMDVDITSDGQTLPIYSVSFGCLYSISPCFYGE